MSSEFKAYISEVGVLIILLGSNGIISKYKLSSYGEDIST